MCLFFILDNNTLYTEDLNREKAYLEKKEIQ